jgi:hypothetical protein
VSCIECEIQGAVSLPCGCERELLRDGACQLVGYDGDASKILVAIEAIGPVVEAAKACLESPNAWNTSSKIERLRQAVKTFEGS